MGTNKDRKLPKKTFVIWLRILATLLPFVGLIIGYALYFINQPIIDCPAKITEIDFVKWREKTRTSPEDRTLFVTFDRWLAKGNTSFSKGDVLQEKVLIVVMGANFSSVDWENYPVKLVLTFDRRGIYETTEQFEAPVSGLCISIIPQ